MILRFMNLRYFKIGPVSLSFIFPRCKFGGWVMAVNEESSDYWKFELKFDNNLDFTYYSSKSWFLIVRLLGFGFELRKRKF